MNGNKRKSMLGTRGNLGLQPLKLNLSSKESSLGKSSRKNRQGMVSASVLRTDQTVAKRLFHDTLKVEKKASISTKSSSDLIAKDKSPNKINCWNKSKKDTEVLPQPQQCGKRNISDNNASNIEKTLSEKSSNVRMSSRFDFLNSPRFLHLNGGKIPQSPKTPPIWSNVSKLKRHSSALMIKSPEELECLSRTLNLLTSTAHKHSSSLDTEGATNSNFNLSSSPNLSAIKVRKPVDKSGDQSVKNLFSFNSVTSCLNDITSSHESVRKERTNKTFSSFVLPDSSNKSNDDSFVENETLCFMDAEDKTLENLADSKENIFKSSPNSSNPTIISVTPHTPRKLSVIPEEGSCGDNVPNSKSRFSCSKSEQISFSNLVNSLIINQESFIHEQDDLIHKLKSAQVSFFSKQNEILGQLTSLIKKVDLESSKNKQSFAQTNPAQNEIVTDCIAGNGNDDDAYLVEDCNNEANISLICATKKLKIQDDTLSLGSPRRSLRILDRLEFEKKSINDSRFSFDSAMNDSTKFLSLNCMDTEVMISEFKSELKTPENQKSGAQLSKGSAKLYSRKNLPRSSSKPKIKTPTCPRKSILIENFSKFETPTKEIPKSPVGLRSVKPSRTPRKSYNFRNSPQAVNSTVLMKNLRRSCAFLKTPKNSTRRSMNANALLTPHSMSLVVQDQMENIFNS